MLEKIEKIKENKMLKTIGNILYIVFFILVVLMLIVVAMQRMTNNNIAIGGFRMFSVATGSMVPVYEVGDVLISKEVEPEKLKVGDDIVYRGEEGSFNNKVVTHRVISIEKQEDGNYKIITQGVANNTQDPEIDQTQVYGKIIYKVRTLSFLEKMIKNIYIFYFIIFVLIAIFIVRRTKSIIKGDVEEEENNGEDSKNTKKDKD